MQNLDYGSTRCTPHTAWMMCADRPQKKTMVVKRQREEGRSCKRHRGWRQVVCQPTNRRGSPNHWGAMAWCMQTLSSRQRLFPRDFRIRPVETRRLDHWRAWSRPRPATYDIPDVRARCGSRTPHEPEEGAV